MRRQLAAREAERRGALVRGASEPPPPEAPGPGRPDDAETGGQSYAGYLGGMMVQGFAMTLGMMLVFFLARSVGLEGRGADADASADAAGTGAGAGGLVDAGAAAARGGRVGGLDSGSESAARAR